MSEPKLISPMLDNFAMGDPISDRNGVRCCPAMENNSDDKYIVKIISVPASQSQLDALILSGAYSSIDAAAEYFKTLANGVVEEVNILEKLAKLEGFLPYSGCQLEPMVGETGYDVYLLSPYRHTLAQLFRRGSMTHLAALNLALDMCAALTICRRSGYLYVDLKPENIYLETGKSNKIGDIGFVSLDSLRWASLPDRYRSSYTAPEVADPFASLNTTMDVYALGLILYQVFNDGLLPSASDDQNSQGFPPPAYADYEMAEIILKACDADPEKRWNDPVEMGQALVSYMQRNGAHDTPIVPVCAPPTEEVSDNDLLTEDAETENPEVVNETNESALEDVADGDVETDISETADSDPEDDATSPYAEDDDGNLMFLDSEDDETTPDSTDDEFDYTEVTEEVSDILQQADELISLPSLDPVIPPEPIDVPIPDPIVPESEEAVEGDGECEAAEADEAVSTTEDADETVAEEEEIAEDEDEEYEEDEQEPEPVKKRHWLRNLLVITFVLAVAAIGTLFYTRYYLQPIDSFDLQEHENGDLTVIVSSPVDESKLSVICYDTYGNQLTKPVVNGTATFTGLAPDSAYTVEVSINGFHRLTGDTSAAFTTPAQTNIVQFHAVTGAEDGSVILSFTIDGPDSSMWKLTYGAKDIDEQTATFSGHMHTITGLTIGAEYNFTLTPETNLNYTGDNQLTHIPSQIVKPVKLFITGCQNGLLTASWLAPENASVESWTVRCYNDSGYDQTVVVNDTSVTFEGVDSAAAYTVEVTAAGMSVGERAYAAANSITVTDFKMDDSNSNIITLSWNSNGNMPENGWLLMYTIDGSAAQEINNLTADTVELANKVPGATYEFTLKTADGSDVLGGQQTLQTAAAKGFSGYGVSSKYMEFKMCERPSKKNWDRYDLSSSDYTSTFTAGKKASFLVHLDRKYSTSKDKITALYVIRNEDGVIVDTSSTTTTWTKMWYRSYCELDIPSLPQTVGKYTISVYFNGALAHSQEFKITD